MARRSDRWITPGVVMVLIFVAGLLVLAVFGAVTYLTVRGFDPAPVVDLVGTLVAAATGCITLVLQLVQRAGVAKVERNTGQLAGHVVDTLDELDRERGRHAYPGDEMGPPPETGAGSIGQDTLNPPQTPRGAATEEARYSDTPRPGLRDTGRMWG